MYEDNTETTEITTINDPFSVFFVPYVYTRSNTAPFLMNVASQILITTESKEEIDLGVPFDNEFDIVYVDEFEVRNTGI